MEKYNFGEEILPGSTMEWALSIVKDDSLVLEVGPAVGTLTKQLKEIKGCSIDIVEIDEGSGKLAAYYARTSCVGTKFGDLEKDCWFNTLCSEKYDYIIILDVLEHLRDPERTLSLLKRLLKGDGEILLSIPNIAHNSIIINLLQNRFVYTSVGLLDDTHVHFFTYESLIEMIRTCGLIAYKKECIQMLVGDNEITNLYSDVMPDIEPYLRTREYADVYQFLFRIKDKKCNVEEPPFIARQLPFTLYSFEVYNQDNVLLETRHINPNFVSEIINLPKNTRNLRIDPLEQPCLLTDLRLSNGSDDEENPVTIAQTNGIILENGDILYFDNDPQIMINVSDITCLKISYKCIGINSLILHRVETSLKLQLDYKRIITELEYTKIELDAHIAQLNLQLEAKESNNSQLELMIKAKEKDTDLLTNQIALLSSQMEDLKTELNLQIENNQITVNSLNSQVNELTAENHSLTEELNGIKSKWFWKIYEKLLSVGKEK